MDKPYHATSDIVVLPAHFPVPGMGLIPINAFVIKGTEPILVDTGMGKDSEEFMNALESVIDPHDLRWIWLTHDDADHTGSIQKVLKVATNARLIANAVGSSQAPLFDNPTTIGFYDHKLDILFSADSFGAIVSAPTQDADNIEEQDLAKGMIL